MRPYYAEGSKTLAYEIAEQLGFRTPDRVVAPIASGSLYTKIAKGFDEWRELGLIEGDAADDERRPGRGLLAGRHGLRRGHRRLPAGQARHDRQVAGHRQPGRRPVRDRARPQQRRRHRRVTDDEIRAGIRLLAETTGIFTETAGGVTTATLAKLAERGDIDPDERVVLVITGEGLKTLDAVRGTFESLRDRAEASTRSSRRSAGVRRLMAVTVKLPTQLRAAAGGASTVAGRRARPSARSSRRCTPQHRELRDRLSDGDGGLRRFVNVYVGGEDIRFGDGLDTPVSDGGEVQILPAVAGG